jgi:hypothetical protein
MVTQRRRTAGIGVGLFAGMALVWGGCASDGHAKPDVSGAASTAGSASNTTAGTTAAGGATTGATTGDGGSPRGTGAAGTPRTATP